MSPRRDASKLALCNDYGRRRQGGGAEADISMVMVGEPTVEHTPAQPDPGKAKPKVTSSAMSTGGLVFARF